MSVGDPPSEFPPSIVGMSVAMVTPPGMCESDIVAKKVTLEASNYRWGYPVDYSPKLQRVTLHALVVVVVHQRCIVIISKYDVDN